jgi:hypothetical protein
MLRVEMVAVLGQSARSTLTKNASQTAIQAYGFPAISAANADTHFLGSLETTFNDDCYRCNDVLISAVTDSKPREPVTQRDDPSAAEQCGLGAIETVLEISRDGGA